MSTLGRGLATIGAAGLSVVTAAAVHARFISPYRPRLEEILIPVPVGHDSLAGLRIGFVTDTHLGPSMSSEEIERAFWLMEATQLDLLLFGGDFISESPRLAEPAAALLGALASRTRYGGLAVLGNHDIAMDGDRMRRALETVNIPVLRNQSVRVATDRGPLWIAGVDETMLGRPNVNATFATIPNRAAVIALWHEPDFARATAERGAFLQLSGHSHGGQIRIPMFGAPATPAGGQSFVRGLYTIDGMPVYTSRGVGLYRPPVRFRCPPEVSLVTLVSSELDAKRREVLHLSPLREFATRADFYAPERR